MVQGRKVPCLVSLVDGQLGRYVLGDGRSPEGRAMNTKQTAGSTLLAAQIVNCWFPYSVTLCLHSWMVTTF